MHDSSPALFALSPRETGCSLLCCAPVPLVLTAFSGRMNRFWFPGLTGHHRTKYTFFGLFSISHLTGSYLQITFCPSRILLPVSAWVEPLAAFIGTSYQSWDWCHSASQMGD